ncbi:MAG: SRPBCC family protein [Candidatus Promineifilaceae bacterium]|nr:SRPBCC family protein [Candidatus Promineifilaceae bacterium]
MTQQVNKTIIVEGEPTTIYDIWANFKNFPHFMDYIKSVEIQDDGSSEWIMAGPAGMEISWQAEITRAERPRRLAWSSKDKEGTVTTSGQITFGELEGGQTEISALVSYSVPAGALGEAAAKLFADPATRLERDLRNFKEFVEKGVYERVN